MIFTPEELTGKALDWAYEMARNPDMTDVRILFGRMEIHITDSDAEYGGSGWFAYKRRLTNEDAARKLVGEKLGEYIQVPTDLISPKYAAITH
jgi:hypothetical protein